MHVVIHPTAVVDSGAELGAGVEIGPLCYVGPGVRLGDRTRLHHHASVKGGRPGVRIGARNVFREYFTVHAATNDGEFTRVGSDNTFLAYGHIAHDCVIGSYIVASNGMMLAGHVVIEDHVVIGGYGGVHQFCRIGAHAMLSATAKLVQDLPPFFIADGAPAVVRAFNKVGLERRGYSPEQIERVKQVFRILYRDGLNRSQALEKLAAHENAATAEFAAMLAFARVSERGLAPGS
ncbi:MAG: acyl-[acyl-carrier-protein]--UDP-N-acetylglucosamine O-acyltransferase [Verrucomicrobia bacterium]|nr:MAG: acyl-[acyl-carrier-protein]--UDP-N-acetylglucosamine O-acyltransferase [Verrucomicrobiota bacterium]